MIPEFSIVIPVLNEAEIINSAISHIRSRAFGFSHEIIVSDGDKSGMTINAIEPDGIITCTGPPGRGAQMNHGAALATGLVLIFIHADTILPEKAFESIRTALSRPHIAAGSFDLGIASDKKALKLIGYAASLRSRLTRIPYGDQAIFIRTRLFKRMGGYAPIPLMEDIELMQRIRQRGLLIDIVKKPVMTSPRRWESRGIIFTTLQNLVLSTLFYLGVPAARLVRYY
ncbi:MAG: glycosyltransferase family 2 protein [Alphaproteobacteria bacterium]|nr:glycosyltransferase family 2 protein [Alphaproteobacteria bacterium]